MRRKMCNRNRGEIGGNQTLTGDAGIGRIRSKVQQMREDLNRFLGEGDRGAVGKKSTISMAEDPRDKGGGGDLSKDFTADQSSAENHNIPIRVRRPRMRDPLSGV